MNFDDLFDFEQMADACSDSSSSVVDGDSGLDSGHESPQSLSSTNSPVSFPWESNSNNEFWSSLLDDLPAEISDTDELMLVPPADNSPLSMAPLNWTNQTHSEESLSNVQNNYIEMADTKNEVIDNITVDCNWDMDLSHLSNTATMNIISNAETTTTEALPTPVSVTNQNKDAQLPAQSLFLKPIAIIRSSDGISKATNVKSHIKIGKNIFAIIQNSNTLKNVSLPSPVKSNISVNKAPAITTIQTNAPNYLFNHKIKIEDHDYAEEEEIDVVGTRGVSKGLGPGLILTDEEKKLLEFENVEIPCDVALTKDEEKMLKKVRRKIKNKQSAMDSRKRRKEYIENLERRVKHCTDLNQGLKKKVDKLANENKSLSIQLKQLQSFVATTVQQGKSVQTGTCLAVLLLSFALFFLPFNPMSYDGGKGVGRPVITDSPNPSVMFRSRTLLQTDDHNEYEYHDNESIASQLGVSNTENESKLYTEEMKMHIENLLAGNDDGYLLKSKLDGYINKNIIKDSTNDLNNFNHVNVVEIREDVVSSRGRVYSDEM